jgi:hypothetical protein
MSVALGHFAIVLAPLVLPFRLHLLSAWTAAIDWKPKILYTEASRIVNIPENSPLEQLS